MGVSRRQYAVLRGVSETAVRKAISSGRIRVEQDGTIDVDKANASWDRQTDPAKQRGFGEQELAAQTRAAMRPVPRAAIDAVADTLRESGADPNPDAPQGEVSFLRARMANEVIKAQTAKVKLQKLKGELVDRARAVAAVFELARRERDAWLKWPPRVAANMAAELNVEAHKLEQALDKYVRENLADMAEVKIELR